MNYILRLVYTDDNVQTMTLSREEATGFFECIGSGKIYWTDETGAGFWTDVNKIRYFQLFPQPQETHEVDAQDPSLEITETTVQEPESSNEGSKEAD